MRKECETNGCVGSEIEGIDETLDSSLDEMMHANEEDTCSEWREGMTFFFSCNNLWKVEELFLEDDKIVPILNSFFIVVSFFGVECSVHDSVDGAFRILGR